jgi:hypothetical protein
MDPNQYYQQKRQQNMEKSDSPAHGTLEVVGLERKQKESETPFWQPYLINGLALIGAAAIIYVIVSAIF